MALRRRRRYQRPSPKASAGRVRVSVSPSQWPGVPSPLSNGGLPFEFTDAKTSDVAFCFDRVRMVKSEELEGKSGRLAGTRTLDQRLKRPLLYQLSYQPTPLKKYLTDR